MTHSYDGLYEATMGAAPTLFIAYVLEYRYVVGNKSNLVVRLIGITTVLLLVNAFIISASQLFYGGQSRTPASIVYLSLFLSVCFVLGTYLMTFVSDWPKREPKIKARDAVEDPK